MAALLTMMTGQQKLKMAIMGLMVIFLVWNDQLGSAFELSSMGIRVDEEALKRQVEMTGDQDRLAFDWHKSLLNGLFL